MIKFQVLTVSLVMALVAVPSHAAQPNGPENLRTIDGRPDLAGVWDFRTLTPLERPENLANKTVLTDEEAADIERKATKTTAEGDQASDRDRKPPPAGQDVGAYNSFWFDSGANVSDDLRTSVIVDPPNGRLPALQEGVKTQVISDDPPTDLPVRLRVGGIGMDGPESRGLSERCLIGFNAGPPIQPGGYNQNIRISQTPEHVVIVNEMVHDARIIPLAAGVRLGLPRWMGESRGRWEGDTLIVETMSFTAKLPSFSPSFFASVGTAEHLHLTERFRRVSEDVLRYEFTVDDPATYTAPFTGVLLMKRSSEQVYEFACHEGNYAMRNMLAGAREIEKLAAEKQAHVQD